MALKFKAVTKTEAAKVLGTGTRASAMRDQVRTLVTEVSAFFEENPDADQLWMEFDADNADNCVGVRWMDLDSDLQDTCKREKGGGMSAIVSNVNRNFKDSHSVRAVLRNPGESAESGNIVFHRYSAKSAS